MMRSVCLAALTVLAPTLASAQPIADAARAQAQMIGNAIDTDNDARISSEELSAFGATVFGMMDTSDDDTIDRTELAAFEFGMVEIADFRDRRQAYDTAQSIVFDIFDRDSDGTISKTEHADGFIRAHAFADTDGDGGLTMEEYLRGFIFNIAMRNAMSER